MNSELTVRGGIPHLTIDGRETAPISYMTYFDENAEYDAFRDAGYSLFSVCAYLTGLPINETTGFTPAHYGGIFDRKGEPDYSEFDGNVAELLRRVPHALFFPRIYVSMPRWWLDENPSACAPAGVTPQGRELLFSDVFRAGAKQLLKMFIEHTESSPYADHIIGYQISGGNTQEWFHFFPQDTYPENAFGPFSAYYEEKYGVKPQQSLYQNKGYVREFLDFINDVTPDTVAQLAALVKEQTGRRKIVGSFYGYNIEVNNAWRGSQGLTHLLDCPDIDFFSTPISYFGSRPFEKEWCAMVAENSVLLHGKAVWTEADVRTHLSRFPDECRKDITIVHQYRESLWLGGPTEADSLRQISRAFVKNICTVRGMWWFDMWGGWYKTKAQMTAMASFRRIADMPIAPMDGREHKLAVLVDEAFARRKPGSTVCHDTVEETARSGIPYDLYYLSDLPAIADRYRLFVLAFDPAETDAEALLSEKGLAYVLPGRANAIREAALAAGIRPLTQSSDILYLGNGFLGLYALTCGEKRIAIPDGFDAIPLLGEGVTVTAGEAVCTVEAYTSILLRLVKQ